MAEAKTALQILKEWDGYKPYPSAYGVERTLAELRDLVVKAIEESQNAPTFQGPITIKPATGETATEAQTITADNVVAWNAPAE